MWGDLIRREWKHQRRLCGAGFIELWVPTGHIIHLDHHLHPTVIQGLHKGGSGSLLPYSADARPIRLELYGEERMGVSSLHETVLFCQEPETSTFC